MDQFRGMQRSYVTSDFSVAFRMFTRAPGEESIVGLSVCMYV